MPRRSHNQITKELALKIVGKLDAADITEPGSPHKEYAVYGKGNKLVATFGIRHSPRKDQGHDHIPKELGVGPNFAKQLGACTKHKPEYLALIGEE